MLNGLLSSVWLGTLGAAVVAVALAPAPASAQQPGQKPAPFKIDAGVNFRFNIHTVPNVVPRAPWYAYFPYDPNLMAPPPGSPYPGWPNPFPPRETPPAGAATPSPADNGPLLPRNSPIAAATGGYSVQPIHYTFHTPAYWYGR